MGPNEHQEQEEQQEEEVDPYVECEVHGTTIRSHIQLNGKFVCSKCMQDMYEKHIGPANQTECKAIKSRLASNCVVVLPTTDKNDGMIKIVTDKVSEVYDGSLSVILGWRFQIILKSRISMLTEIEDTVRGCDLDFEPGQNVGMAPKI